MEHHPLLITLQKIAQLNNVDESRVHLTFQCFLEILHEKKYCDIKYDFNESLKIFYFLAKKEANDQSPDVLVPVLPSDEISPEDIDILFFNLCPLQAKLHLIICDRNSVSTCYKITKGLVKPDSVVESKKKREKDLLNFQLDQIIQKNKKKLYMKALNKHSENK